MQRIGLGVLSDSGFGSVVLPQDKLLHCPQCGELCEDEGQCKIVFALTENTHKLTELVNRAPLLLSLIADCRTCGYYGQGPTLDFINPFDKR